MSDAKEDVFRPCQSMMSLTSRKAIPNNGSSHWQCAASERELSNDSLQIRDLGGLSVALVG